jgi:hypothetical protein
MGLVGAVQDIDPEVRTDESFTIIGTWPQSR